MSIDIQLRIDKRRGCGWRQPGGTYLISEGVARSCGLLPVPLDKCPTCSGGIKPSRGWTWIDFEALVTHGGIDCKSTPDHCQGCPFKDTAFGEQQGLLWIGGSFYKTPEEWTAEAVKQGVSRRISQVPRDFVIGETWCLVAHREAIEKDCPKIQQHLTESLEQIKSCEHCEGAGVVRSAAIFHAFKPTAIEYVVKGDETEEQLQRLVDRGITPVRVEHAPDDDQPELTETEDQTEVEEEACLPE